MKIRTTNYFNTLIAVAEDCPVKNGTVPPEKNRRKTVANLQFEMIQKNPFKYNSDDVLFYCHAIKNSFENHSDEKTKMQFFSKGQPCLRTSPLAKKYGWGIFFNELGKVTLIGSETDEYQQLFSDEKINVVKAMRNSGKRG